MKYKEIQIDENIYSLAVESPLINDGHLRSIGYINKEKGFKHGKWFWFTGNRYSAGEWDNKDDAFIDLLKNSGFLNF